MSYRQAAEKVPRFSDFLRVFHYATNWDFCVYGVATAASLASGATLPLMNIIFGQLVGQFSEFFAGSSSLSASEFRRILNQQALLIMALFVGRWGLNSINKFCFRMIGIRLSSEVRMHYMRSLFAQPIHVIDSMDPGVPATTITATANTLQLGISERLGTFLQFNGTVWAALIIAFIWSWDLALVTLSLVLYILVVVSILMPITVRGYDESNQADSKGTAIASEALGGIRLVMAFNAQKHILARYSEWMDEAKKKGQRTSPLLGLEFGLVFFGIFGAYGLAFWYGAKRFIDGAIANSGTIIVVLMSIMMVLTSLERIMTPLQAISKAAAAACEFFTVIDAPLPYCGSLRPEITAANLVFENVTFEYPTRPGVKALDGLSLCIQSGRNNALVGASGSGKSTIVALLERWYSLGEQHLVPRVVEQNPSPEPDAKGKDQVQGEGAGVQIKTRLSGSIKVAGHNLEDLDLKWWRTQIGLVQQDPFLYNSSIFDNVANGLIGTQWEEHPEEEKRELVQEACKDANVHDFVSNLPEGYDTRVGDGGVKLSGGQKQRIAIARSIVKRPQIMILDEATSAIDPASEKVVQAAIDKVTKARTTITIAHRLSTVQKADHIAVLQSGRVVEQGTHQSLLNHSSSLYSTLVRAQKLRLPLDEEHKPAVAAPGLEHEEEPNKVMGYDTGRNEKLSIIGKSQDLKIKADRGFAQSLGAILYNQRAKWPSYLGIVISAAAVAACTPIQAWLFSKVVGMFLLSVSELEDERDFWSLMWLCLAAGVGLSWLITGWTAYHLQYSISATHKLQHLTDMLHQEIAFFDEDSNSHGSLTSRIGIDAKQLEELLGMNLASLLSGVFMVTGCVIISIIFSWELGLVAVFVTIPLMVGTGLWKYQHEVQFNKMNENVFVESSQFATEAIESIRTVSSLTMEDSVNRRYEKLLFNHVRDALHKARWTSVLYGFADSASLGCQALIFWYGGRLMAKGKYSLEAFFVCFMAIIQGAEAASQVLAMAPSAAQATSAANRMLDIQRSAGTQQDISHTMDQMPSKSSVIEVELQDVSFTYPTRDISIFQNLSLSIGAGQFAAFVGPSGSGKTSIISLLERFYNLKEGHGSIFCNGVNIKDLEVHKYRQNISLVPQEPTMFRGTIRDNILLGISHPGAVSEERIHSVCKDAFIHDLIISLPEGYNTDVGQKGVFLSGGQKQRIAIARALIREPGLLLLDEATSALDSESEKIVQAAFEKARAGRTTIAVAHRLSTIQNADIIFVFDKGRMIEKGTHDELIWKRGTYYSMCEIQALDR